MESFASDLRQKESLCFRLAQRDPRLFIVRQKEPDFVRARWSFVCQQNCKCVARTSLRSCSALDDALNAFGLFARALQRFLLDNAIAMLMLVRWGISSIESRCA